MPGYLMFLMMFVSVKEAVGQVDPWCHHPLPYFREVTRSFRGTEEVVRLNACEVLAPPLTATALGVGKTKRLWWKLERLGAARSSQTARSRRRLPAWVTRPDPPGAVRATGSVLTSLPYSRL